MTNSVRQSVARVDTDQLGGDVSFGYCIDCEYCRSSYGDLGRDCVVELTREELAEQIEMGTLEFVCRRHPPVTKVLRGRGVSISKFLNVRPVIDRTIGCGEFEQAKKTRTGTGA